jgi:probable phosphoglycerate mutase
VLDPALRERHIGDIQGLTLQDAVKEKPEAYKAFMSHKRNKQIPVSIRVFLLLRKCFSVGISLLFKHCTYKHRKYMVTYSHNLKISEVDLHRYYKPTIF